MRIHKNDAAVTAQKMKFSIKNFLSKCYQIHSFLLIWSHLLKKPLMENFIFCAVGVSSCNSQKLQLELDWEIISK